MLNRRNILCLIHTEIVNLVEYAFLAFKKVSTDEKAQICGYLGAVKRDHICKLWSKSQSAVDSNNSK